MWDQRGSLGFALAPNGCNEDECGSDAAAQTKLFAQQPKRENGGKNGFERVEQCRFVSRD